MRISDWSSDVCSSDLRIPARPAGSRNPLIPRSCRSGGAAPTMQKMTSNRFRWAWWRSEEHTSELQSLMRISYAVFCLKKKKTHMTRTEHKITQANHQHICIKTRTDLNI